MLSTQAVDANNINIYPNPSSGWVNVDLNSVNGVVSIQVVDVAGRLVTTQPINSTQKSYAIDMGTTKAGVYFVQVITDGGLFNKKIIITQ